MSTETEVVQQNPAEPVADVATTAEPAQPPEPDDGDVVMERPSDAPETETGSEPETEPETNPDSEVETSEVNQTDEEVEVTETGTDEEDQGKSGEDDEEETTEKVDTGADAIHAKEYTDNFAQTFVKYTKNLPEKRFVEIVNMEMSSIYKYVDYEFVDHFAKLLSPSYFCALIYRYLYINFIDLITHVELTD